MDLQQSTGFRKAAILLAALAGSAVLVGLTTTSISHETTGRYAAAGAGAFDYLGAGLIPNGGFENGFFGWTVQDSVFISGNAVHSGSYAARASDPDTTSWAYFWREIGFAYDTTEVSVWVYPESPRYRQVFELISGWQGGTAVSITHVTFRNDALIFFSQGTSEWIPKPLNLGMWNHVLVKANASTGTQELYVNDSLYSTITSEELPLIEHLLVGDVSRPANWGTVYYDDIAITGSVTTPAPVAVDDQFVDNSPSAKFLPLLNNDLIPPGTQVQISIETPPQQGQILSIEENGIWYQKNDGADGQDELSYSLNVSGAQGKSDQNPIATLILTLAECVCGWVETPDCPLDDDNIALGRTTAPFANRSLNRLLGKALGVTTDSLDLPLLYRWRDELLMETAAGAALVEDLGFHSPELLQIVVIDRPEIRGQIVRLFIDLQESARSMLEGDGSAVISQAQMDSVAALFASIQASSSEAFAAALREHEKALGPFDKYVGMTVQEAFAELGGTGTAIEADPTQQPEGFTLEQNFPNPFRAETTIRFVLDNTTEASLSVYDVRGRSVKTLLREERRQGAQSVTWDGRDNRGSDLPSGVYFIRLEVGSEHQSRRIVHVR